MMSAEAVGTTHDRPAFTTPGQLCLNCVSVLQEDLEDATGCGVTVRNRDDDVLVRIDRHCSSATLRNAKSDTERIVRSCRNGHC